MFALINISSLPCIYENSKLSQSFCIYLERSIAFYKSVLVYKVSKFDFVWNIFIGFLVTPGIKSIIILKYFSLYE
jgi:hypothetical protein